MAKKVTKYKIFIASPSDLIDDRQSIDEVIKELNLTFGDQNNLIIELVKWETHSAPGVSTNGVQEIINKDIGNDYDLFIGLMWLKFGTPTSVAGSGTEEEFLAAYKKFTDGQESIQILFYFNNSTPLNLQDINPDELNKVNSFRNKIENKGVLYWNYSAVEELQGFLRIHIPKRITTLMENEPLKTQKTMIVEDDKTILSDDLGLLDYIEISDESFEKSTIAMANIAEATEWIGKKIGEKTEEMNNIAASGIQVSNRNLKKILKLTAQVMNEYASRLIVETPIFFGNYEEGIKAISSLINISDDFYNKKNINELISSKKSIIEMETSAVHAINGMSEFYDSVITLPRIDKEINRAKKNVADKLGELISRLQTSSKLAVELIKEVSEKIDRIEIDSSEND